MSHWCEYHVTYEAKRKPQSKCKRCWDLYLISHPEDKHLAPEHAPPFKIPFDFP